MKIKSIEWNNQGSIWYSKNPFVGYGIRMDNRGFHVWFQSGTNNLGTTNTLEDAKN